MNYQESISYLESLSPTKQPPRLERMACFMQERGSLQDAYPTIHVGGTNGKGSTVAMLTDIFRLHGLKVGRFIGPHLMRWNERLCIDGQAISDEKLAALVTRVAKMSEEFGMAHPEFGPLTWFELITTLAFFYFAEHNVDLAVIEVGLGGRFDSTNVISHPLVSVITNVDLDHTHILGSTVQQIAMEKAGIIKFGVPVVTAVNDQVFGEICEVAEKKQAPVIHLDYREGQFADRYYSIGLDDKHVEQYLSASESLSLPGAHQQLNARVAITAALVAACGLGMTLKPEIVKQALSQCYWPGRLQYLPELNLVLDGAHNPAGAVALRAALNKLFPGRDLLFVIGCFENKDTAALLKALIKPGDHVFACQPNSKRVACLPDELAKLATTYGAQSQIFYSIKDALQEAISTRAAQQPIITTGSFAVVKETMQYLGWSQVDDGRPLFLPI